MTAGTVIPSGWFSPTVVPAIEHGGHGWATDGACLVRIDQRPPDLDPARSDDWPGWATPDAIDNTRLAPLVRLLERPRSARKASRRTLLHPRFGDLVRAADELDMVTGFLGCRVVRCWAGGELVAAIAVMVADPIGVTVAELLAGGAR